MHNNINVNVSGPVQPTSTYKTKVLKGNHSFASQVTEPNMKYVIKHNFDLGGGSVTIPENCTLEFDGGSLSNGTVIGQKTILEGSIRIETHSGTFISYNNIPLDNSFLEYKCQLNTKDVFLSWDFCIDPEDDYDFNVMVDSLVYCNEYFIAFGPKSGSDNTLRAIVFRMHNKVIDVIGYSIINVTCHGSSASIKGGYVYIIDSYNSVKIDIASLIDNAETCSNTSYELVEDMSGWRAGVWYEDAKEWCYIRKDEQGFYFNIYDENYNIKKTSRLTSKVKGYYLDDIRAFQDLYYDGYFIYTFVVWQGRQSLFVIIDANSGEIVSSTKVNSNEEPEGIVKIGNDFYYVSNDENYIVFGMLSNDVKQVKYTLDSNNLGKSHDSVQNIYVNNTYNGVISGYTSDFPFKRISQAMYFLDNDSGANIFLNPTNKPYIIKSLNIINTRCTIRSLTSNTKPILYIGNANIRNSAVNFMDVACFGYNPAASMFVFEGSGLYFRNCIVNVYNCDSCVKGNTHNNSIYAQSTTFNSYQSQNNYGDISEDTNNIPRNFINNSHGNIDFVIDNDVSIVNAANICKKDKTTIVKFYVNYSKLPVITCSGFPGDEQLFEFDVTDNTNVYRLFLWIHNTFKTIHPTIVGNMNIVRVSNGSRDSLGLSYDLGKYVIGFNGNYVSVRSSTPAIVRPVNTDNYNVFANIDISQLSDEKKIILNCLYTNMLANGVYTTDRKLGLFYTYNISNPNNYKISKFVADSNSIDTGSTRPSLGASNKGYNFFDETLNKPIWWNGSAWVDATGATV